MANLEIMTNPMRGMLYPVRGHVRAFKSGDISHTSNAESHGLAVLYSRQFFSR